jgi:hypothetical protein
MLATEGVRKAARNPQLGCCAGFFRFPLAEPADLPLPGLTAQERKLGRSQEEPTSRDHEVRLPAHLRSMNYHRCRYR